MLAFGLRRGEALGLHWSALAGMPRSRRTLFLTPELVELLRRHRAHLAEERMAIRQAWREYDLIF
jgi:integrase